MLPPPKKLSEWISQEILEKLIARTSADGSIELVDPDTDKIIAIIHKDRELAETSGILVEQILTPWGPVFYDHESKGNTTAKGIRYSPLWADLFCEYIANGSPISQICKLPNMPPYSSIFRWRRLHSDFEEKLQMAYEARAEIYRDRIEEQNDQILDDAPEDFMKRVKHIEGLKHLAARDNPSRHGNKVEVHNTHAPVRLIVETGIKYNSELPRVRELNAEVIAELDSIAQIVAEELVDDGRQED